jgi:hypothetical protein
MAVAVLVALVGCDSGHRGSGKAPPQNGVTSASFVASHAVPPVGLTWHVAFNENVSEGSLDNWYSKFIRVSANLWSVTEGQLYISKVILTDDVKKDYVASRMFSFDVPSPVNQYDVMIFSNGSWDVGAAGFVIIGGGLGRMGRMIGVPEGASDLTNIHEAAHMVFKLTWSKGPLLVDEYADGMQDAACIMELTWSPLKWCGDVNHVDQSSQPHACWTQVLSDYPNFTYNGIDEAPSPPPMTDVEYNDTP